MKKENRKSCLVLGYMNNNLGDDLFFRILFERYPNIDFYIYPPSILLDKYKFIYSKYDNVIFYENEEYYKKQRQDIVDVNTPINLFPMICERAKIVDYYVNIGGSIFIQNKNWKNDDRFILKKLFGPSKPSFIVGCNFGPGDKEFTKFYKNWFKNFTDVCFRDMYSYNKFKYLKNVRNADDIVLLERNKHKINKLVCKMVRKGLAISVMDISNHDKLIPFEDSYYDFLIKMIKKFVRKKETVTLFSYCSYDGDINAINKIMNRLNNDEKHYVRVVNYNNDISLFMKAWSKNEYVIATRFHSLILSMVYDQKVYPLVYSRKTINYLKTFDDNIDFCMIEKIGKINIDNIKFCHIRKKFCPNNQFKVMDKYFK